jgi:CRISPR-associated protein Cas5d
MIDSLCWHPQYRWVVDKIIILNPIIVASEMHSELPKDGGDTSQLRTTQVLRNVAYGVEFHFEPTDRWHEPGRDGKPYTDGKVLGMMSRHIEKGQHQAYLGLREYGAEVVQVDKFPRSCYEGYEHDFGIMLYEPDYGKVFDKDLKVYTDIPRNWYYHAYMRDGIIDVKAARENGEVFQ